MSLNSFDTVMVFSMGFGVAQQTNTRLGFGVYNTGWMFSEHTTDLSVDTWYHACAVERSATSHQVYLDGNAGPENTTSKVPANIDALDIGVQFYSSSDHDEEFNGQLAEVGIWDVDLDDGEIAALAAGYAPSMIRPQNLVWYLPLVNDIKEVVQNQSWTSSSNSGATNHPRIIQPSAQILQFPSAASGVTITDVDGDEAWNDADAGLVIVGTGFL